MNDREDELHAAHRVRYSMRERVAGLLIIGALVLLVLSIVFNDRIMFTFADTFSLHAYVENAEDVDDGAAVKLDGIEVGRVDNVELTDDARIRITLKVRERFHEQVRENSVLEVSHLTVLGDGGVSISRGDPELPMLEDGATIKVKESVSMEELLSQITPAIDDIAVTAQHVREIVQAIEPGTTATIVDDVS
ncbi:MAG: MCE family protein, partial [Proteobacteria bacterium]|nr:MCE family protein [Pseudomonadota bacterium]